MTSARFLRLAIPAAAGPALLAVALQGAPALWYTGIVYAGSLFASAVLSLWVAAIYRSHLKRAFLYLTGYFFTYGLITTPLVTVFLARSLGDNFLTVLLAWQIVSYSMLLLACVNITRAIGLGRLSRTGNIVVAALSLVALGLVLSALPLFLEQYPSNSGAAIVLLVVRIFDMAVMLMMVPVILLYVQNARTTYQESTSFAVIATGIVASLELVYFYEVARGQSIAAIAAQEFQKGSLLDALYIFSFLVVVAGLYAHRKHQDWSLRAVEDVLAF